jgi:ribosomal protein S18 acetylase RimI-like enzyme
MEFRCRCDLVALRRRSSVGMVTDTKEALGLHHRVRARMARWPYESDVTQIILLDHQMVPTPTSITGWVTDALDADPDVRAIRTGAVFPAAAAAFTTVGFHPIDSLALLEARLERESSRSPRRRRAETQRLRASHLTDVAALDRRAFGDPWGNDIRSLNDIADATPRHRARIVTTIDADGTTCIGGFALTGQSGAFGYLQRLAVDTTFRRRGIARRLVDDSMHWMQRRGATTAMVNTALDNDAALALYADAGFRRRSETLTILELSGEALRLHGATQ